jgi:uncharacterized OB-fold protein
MTGAPPLITEIARPWWDALARDAIEMQRCDACEAWIFYPRPFCTTCGGRSLTWAPVEGPATLYTWSVARVPISPAFAHLDQPLMAVAELANGVRVPTTLVDISRDEVRIGMMLAPLFDRETYPNVTLLRFLAANGKTTS